MATTLTLTTAFHFRLHRVMESSRAAGPEDLAPFAWPGTQGTGCKQRKTEQQRYCGEKLNLPMDRTVSRSLADSQQTGGAVAAGMIGSKGSLWSGQKDASNGEKSASEECGHPHCPALLRTRYPLNQVQSDHGQVSAVRATSRQRGSYHEEVTAHMQWLHSGRYIDLPGLGWPGNWPGEKYLNHNACRS